MFTFKLKQNKEKPAPTIREVAKKHKENLDPDQILHGFFYNRSQENTGFDSTEGVVVLMKDCIAAYDEGMNCEYPLALLKTARMESAYGGVMIYLVTNSGEEHLLCAADRSYMQTFAEGAEKIRNHLAGNLKTEQAEEKR